MKRFFSLAVGLVGCNLISGVDDFQFGGAPGVGASGAGGSGANAGAPAGGNGGTGGTGGSGGAGGVGGAGGGAGGSCNVATQKECSGDCVSLTDPAFGCDDASCGACAAGSSCCPDCTNTSSNPKRCGSCNGSCDNDEWCVASMCECRPGLVLSGQSCVDPDSNAAACGGGAACSGGTPLCQNGSCVAACSGPFTQCGSGCVNQETDPLHCGGCTPCDVDKLCVDGACEEYKSAEGCSSCPCAACTGDFNLCCNFPGSNDPVCVNQDAGGCP